MGFWTDFMLYVQEGNSRLVVAALLSLLFPGGYCILQESFSFNSQKYLKPAPQ